MAGRSHRAKQQQAGAVRILLCLPHHPATSALPCPLSTPCHLRALPTQRTRHVILSTTSSSRPNIAWNIPARRKHSKWWCSFPGDRAGPSSKGAAGGWPWSQRWRHQQQQQPAHIHPPTKINLNPNPCVPGCTWRMVAYDHISVEISPLLMPPASGMTRSAAASRDARCAATHLGMARVGQGG